MAIWIYFVLVIYAFVAILSNIYWLFLKQGNINLWYDYSFGVATILVSLLLIIGGGWLVYTEFFNAPKKNFYADEIKLRRAFNDDDATKLTRTDAPKMGRRMYPSYPVVVETNEAEFTTAPFKRWSGDGSISENDDDDGDDDPGFEYVKFRNPPQEDIKFKKDLREDTKNPRENKNMSSFTPVNRVYKRPPQFSITPSAEKISDINDWQHYLPDKPMNDIVGEEEDDDDDDDDDEYVPDTPLAGTNHPSTKRQR